MNNALFYPMFVYGFTFDSSNNRFDIDEGGGQLTVTIPLGSYSISKFCLELQKALNVVGTLGYTVSLNRSNFSIKIEAQTGQFKILGETGDSFVYSCLPVMGFEKVDTNDDSVHIGSPVPNIYRFQFPPQSYVPADKNKGLTSATVVRSASGNNVSVQYFAEERFIELEIKLANNIQQHSGSPLRTNRQGIEDLTSLMDYLISLEVVEFIPDDTNPENFYKVRLESTPESQDGVYYKLKEHWDMNLPNYFTTGILKFRVIKES